MSARVAVVGARGHVASELVPALARHDRLELAYVGSRKLAGTAVADTLDIGNASLTFESHEPGPLAARLAALACDAVVLALPNGLAANYVAALDEAGSSAAIVDLSADHRFDDGWVYGLIERQRAALAGAKRIANPGCYATGAQLGLAPVAEALREDPHVFGVSGYSGAGTTPSRRNDPEVLAENLIPYKLTGHTHEREISRHLGRPVRFMPHVAGFFRGITLTIACRTVEARTASAWHDHYARWYEGEAGVTVHADAPEVKDAVGDPRVHLGGFAAQDDRLVVIATLDNLLKGAATQALQNLELALFGLEAP